MSPIQEARADLRAYMNRSVAYIGPFELVYEALFGPFDHNAHVTCRAAHIEAGSLAERLRRADEAVRAECARMSAEFQAKHARDSRPTLIAAE